MATEAVSAPPSYDVFISYSRKDKAFAAMLEAALERYRPPKGMAFPHRRLRVFRDEDDFTGTEYHAALRQHLHTSAKLLVICSPAARQSRYVDDEIRQFAAIRGPEHIVPVLIAGLPNNEATGDQDQDLAFPQALSEALALPLAADFRGFDPRRHKFGGSTGDAAWHGVRGPTTADTKHASDIGWLNHASGSELVEAACRQKLRGLSTLTDADAKTFLSLTARVGTDVCAPVSTWSCVFDIVRHIRTRS